MWTVLLPPVCPPPGSIKGGWPDHKMMADRVAALWSQRAHTPRVVVTLLALGLLVLVGVGLLAAGRHDQPPAEHQRRPVTYYHPQRFAIWPTASKPRPIPYRSRRWQLGFGLVVYPLWVAVAIDVVWFVRFLFSH